MFNYKCVTMIKINLFDKISLKGGTFIEGFPGVGLVGPMAISYIIDKLAMSYVGSIESDDFPPLVSIHDNKPLPPVRLYWSPKLKVFTVFAEFPMAMNLIHPLSDAIFAFLEENGISKIISIGGLPVPAPYGKTVFVVASNDKSLSEAVKAGMKPVSEGVSAGVSALLLLMASKGNIPAINILIPLNEGIIDPGNAELAIVTLNKLMNLKIDIDALDKEAKAVEAKIRELLKKSQETHETYKRSVGGSGPSMYA
jgi:uncharacterized protein